MFSEFLSSYCVVTRCDLWPRVFKMVSNWQPSYTHLNQEKDQEWQAEFMLIKELLLNFFAWRFYSEDSNRFPSIWRESAQLQRRLRNTVHSFFSSKLLPLFSLPHPCLSSFFFILSVQCYEENKSLAKPESRRIGIGQAACYVFTTMFKI